MIDHDPASSSDEQTVAGNSKFGTMGPRIWPGIVLVCLQWLLTFVPAWLAPNSIYHFYGMMSAPLVGFGGCVLWWLFASRTTWLDRLTTLSVVALGAVTALMTYHPSFKGMIVM